MSPLDPSLEDLEWWSVALTEQEERAAQVERDHWGQYWEAAPKDLAALDRLLQGEEARQCTAAAEEQRLIARLHAFEREIRPPVLDGKDLLELHIVPDLSFWPLTQADILCVGACLRIWRGAVEGRPLVLHVRERLREMTRDLRHTPEYCLAVCKLYEQVDAPLQPLRTRIGFESLNHTARIWLQSLLWHYDRERPVIKAFLRTYPVPETLCQHLHLRYPAHTAAAFLTYVDQALAQSSTKPPRVRADYLTMAFLAPTYGVASINGIRRALTRARRDHKRQDTLKNRYATLRTQHELSR
jgi:hypothetical protein